jgi:23S rRNA (adenine2503-C2)-methyltransferase
MLEVIRRMAGIELGGLGGRQKTVSTVGIVPGIEAMADVRLGPNLAISLQSCPVVTDMRRRPARTHPGPIFPATPAH